jgi:hypothetical protein
MRASLNADGVIQIARFHPSCLTLMAKNSMALKQRHSWYETAQTQSHTSEILLVKSKSFYVD